MTGMEGQVVEGEERGITDTWQSVCLEGCREIFASLREEEFAKLKEVMMPLKYGEDDLIFPEGAYASGIYIVYKGLVKYGKRGGGAKQSILRLVGPKEIFGEDALFAEGSSRPAYARALTEAEIVFIEKSALLTFLKEHPSMVFNLCEKLVKTIQMLEGKIMRSACRTIKENVALILLSLASQYGQRTKAGLYIGVDIKREVLADMLGISIESLMSALAELRDRGIISVQDRKIFILDEKKLKDLAKPLPIFLEGKLL